MMKNKSTLNIIKNKYLYVITLFALGLITLIGSFNLKVEPNDSLHLSSSMTDYEKVQSEEPNNTATEQYYDLQLRLLENHTVTMDSTKEPVTLRKGTILSVSVPYATLRGGTDISKINLNQVISKLDTVTEIPYTGRNEVVISEGEEYLAPMIGETTKINLRLIAQRKKLKVERVEKEVDDGSNYEEAKNEGKVCTSCLELQTLKHVDKKLDIIEFYKNLVGIKKPALKSMDEAVVNYEKSKEVKKLLDASKKGYMAKRGRRKSYPRSNRESGSIGACYNGVKTLLLKSGIVRSRFTGEAAKGAGPQLVKNGFINLMGTEFKNKIKSPYDAPTGAVLVYESYGKNPGKRVDPGFPYGHIEVRTEKGFISDYYSTRARTGDELIAKRRRLIGVYIKGTPEIKNYLAYQETKKQGRM